MAQERSIRQRLIGGFLILAVILAVTGVVGIWMVQHVGKAADVIYHEEYAVVRAANIMHGAVEEQLYLMHASLMGDTKAKSRFDDSAREYADGAKELLRCNLSADESAQVREVDTLYGQFQKAAGNAMNAASPATGATPDAKSAEGFRKEAVDHGDKIEARLADMAKHGDAEMAKSMASADSTETASLWILTLIVAVGFAAAVGLGIWYANGISHSILAGVNVVGSAVAEISASVTQLASSSSETASAVAETTTTVEEVKQTSQIAVQKAREVSETARRTVDISRKGESAAQLTQREIDRIRRQMELVAESIVKLSEQSQAIAEIISSVDDLSEQSNLLAVNAAIEAAKAGEQGRGFAIVAQEIKNLAEQSKQATGRVRAILGDIQKATGGAVLATEQGGKAVDAGVKQAGEAGESIRALAESVGEAAQAAAQIAASSQQQFAGVDQVTRAMENIKQAAGQNAESTRQLEASAKNLRELGEQLKRIVIGHSA